MEIVPVPAQKATKAETFTTLCDDFQLDKKVFLLFMNSPMESLEDFRYYFVKEEEMDSFLAQDSTLKDAPLRLQIARLRRAWSAVRQCALKRESGRQASTAVELDDLLEEATLREVKVSFWRRYRLRYPAEVMPSDQLVSRCYRELDKRLLAVYNVWTVKTLMYQVTSNRKRKQVGTDLYVLEDDRESLPAKSADKYLALLHAYLLSLAVAGSSRAPGAPAEAEPFGSDPTKYVVAPWDVLQAYHFRAVRCAQLIPEMQRVAWLERIDVAERAVWVSQFREGTETLGQVVQSVMDRRGAHWEAPLNAATLEQGAKVMDRRGAHWEMPQDESQSHYGRDQQQQQPQRRSDGGMGSKGGRGGKGSKGGVGTATPGKGSPGRGGSPGWGSVAATLKDGIALCVDFQRGACAGKGRECPKGMHKCARVTSRGRVCGMLYHGAHQCRQK